MKQQGITKKIPDNITYYNGLPFIKYYNDDNSGKIAFVATIVDDNSLPQYIYCGVAHREDLKKMGSFVYDFSQEGKLLSETFYNNQGEQVTDISYTYHKNVPFPIISNYNDKMGEECSFYDNYFNIGQRFWVYDSLLEFDENDRWVKYNGDIYNDYYPDEGIESYNIPVYDEAGRLQKIVETLRGSRFQDNPKEWIEDGEITFKYSDGGKLIQVDYSGFSGTHGSSGNSGWIFYDELGRIVHIESFHSSGNYHRFYLYHDADLYPFAIFKIGGIPYSGEEFDGYEMIYGMDTNVWLLLDE